MKIRSWGIRDGVMQTWETECMPFTKDWWAYIYISYRIDYLHYKQRALNYLENLRDNN